MLKTVKRGLVAATILALPLTAAPAGAAADAAPATGAPMTLADGISLLPVAAESREGYQRTSFKHWVDNDRDGCNTRSEVLISESRTAPTIETGCKVTAGEWFSYYDGVTVTAPGGLDIDHMVPLAEAWDSGASAWTAQRREAYANDLDADRSLVAVTAKTNRSKADQDPQDWLPPLADARCTYIADWVSTKLRWSLAVDQAERAALTRIAAGCGQETVEYTPAP
ncbi:HNH endonuclease family protein [Streptomyces scopuliridis]|uniref:HNH endonuclease family protein n=1 Tax=Streptomyces scopuliridis TaxID=452529 RepID=A0ACD4ZP48_9ACTN|nr:HNH endonuclease family protein [Streptomyces scopuliridis]WSC00091.1 HNH endonuclease family protein [Streptomyces scopuliridis]